MSVITVPFVSLGPGPTFNTLGQVEGKEVVDIKGTKVDPVSGHLNMTTVSQRDGLTLADALRLWASGSEQLVPRDVVYPPDRSKDQVDKENDLEFKKSEESAEFAALGYLKYPAAVTVLTISDDGPSKGKLQQNDAITAVNGHPVATLDEFTGQLKLTKPGDEVMLDYKRKNAPNGTVKITLGKNGDRDYGFLGVGVVQAPWAPFTIDFNLANIGGPSAGLMFSLAVIDKLTPGELMVESSSPEREPSTPRARWGPSVVSRTRCLPPKTLERRYFWCPRPTVPRRRPMVGRGSLWSRWAP